MRTIGDIYYQVQHIKEYWKKKFELTQEMRSAYAFINLRGPTGLGGRKAMGNLIESTVSDIKDKFAGAQRRKYIRDEILLNPKARPHEVLAGLMIVFCKICREQNIIGLKKWPSRLVSILVWHTKIVIIK